MKDAVLLNSCDCVATVTRAFDVGEHIQIGNQTIILKQAIPFAHKVAIRPIAKGAPVIKYGEPIGLATADIAVGELVHIHNLKSNRGLGA